MANTHFIKTEIEPYVVKFLSDKHGLNFAKKRLPVGMKNSGEVRLHEFDAVSESGSIVAEIKSHSGKTSGGKRPAGKIAPAYKELFFLSLVKAERRLLVVTDPEYHDILHAEFEGILPQGVEVVLCPLPDYLQEKLNSLRGNTD